MSRTRFLLAFSAVAVLGIGFYGCSNPESTDPAPAASTADDHDHEGDDDHEHGDKSEQSSKSEAEKAVEGLAGLSDDDRAAAEKQKTCPVSDEMLGVEGKPVKVTVKDQDIWVCCEGCGKELLDNPEKFLAKMNK